MKSYKAMRLGLYNVIIMQCEVIKTQNYEAYISFVYQNSVEDLGFLGVGVTFGTRRELRGSGLTG